MNANTEYFELITCDICSIVLEEEQNYIVGILAKNIEYGISLIGYEGTMITFVNSGCAHYSHIPTIYQILLRFKEDSGFKLECVIIEAKYGDVFYCRLKWTKDKKSIYNVCSIGDGIIFQLLTECQLFITRFVLDQLEPFDSEGYAASYEN